jgi:hypothetical protein
MHSNANGPQRQGKTQKSLAVMDSKQMRPERVFARAPAVILLINLVVFQIVPVDMCAGNVFHSVTQTGG